MHKILGMVDYNGNGVRNCEARFTWKLKDGRFTMQAEIWNPRYTDILLGGQCIEEVAKFFPHNRQVRRMVQIWRRWHLNDMRAGCEHQRANKWEDIRINPEELPGIRANRDEKGVLAISVTQEEHADGLLARPCLTCGYKYGTQWLREEIPALIQAEIHDWH